MIKLGKCLMMYNLDYTEFYITNVCNLNCSNCNRFNNFAFSGHELWSNYKEVYAQWSKKMQFKKIGILGGEPMLNPEFMDWLNGVIDLWPDSRISVVTNGTQLNRWPELYTTLLNNNNRVWLEVTVHNATMKDDIHASLERMLVGPIKKEIKLNSFSNSEWKRAWAIIRGSDWPDCESPNDFTNMPEWIQQECRNKHNLGHEIWIDSNGVTIDISVVTKFFTSATIVTDLNNLTLHDSNPAKAVQNCISKFCHHFSRGKLYKCGVAGILPDLVDQFVVNLPEENKKFIKSYVPAEHDWDESQFNNFLTNLKQGLPIDQCQFCPETYKEFEFAAGVKKIKIQRK